MKAIVFGASGMVGQGVLRECLLSSEVERVLAVGRSLLPEEKSHPKLEQRVVADLSQLGDSATESEALRGYDACFWCLGVSSTGLSEATYRQVTFDLAIKAGRLLAKLNPSMTLVFISGAGAGSRGAMWARVKAETEEALRALPFKAVYVFRPGFIEPLHGITSRTKLYRWLYPVFRPLVPLLKAAAPKQVLTTERLGWAMLEAAAAGAPKAISEAPDINLLADRAATKRTSRAA